MSEKIMNLVLTEKEDPLTTMRHVYVDGWLKEDIDHQETMSVTYTREEEELAKFDIRQRLIGLTVLEVVAALDKHRKRI